MESEGTDGRSPISSEEVAELIDVARAVIDAGSDGFRHTVGSAVRDTSGQTYAGVNVYHFTGGPCAELVALGAARAAGATDLDVIVAVGDEGRGVLSPCGRCRQVLVDLHPAIRVVVPTPDGDRVTDAADLLPFGYSSRGEVGRSEQSVDL